MKTNKQILGLGIFSVAALLYIFIVYFISHRPPKTVTEVYFADRMTEAHYLLIDRYNAAHAGSIKIIPVNFPISDFSTDARKEILARSLRGEDDAIDLLAVDVIWVHRFAKWCEPLGKYFNDQERRRITESALQTCYHEGELVAVPLDFVQGVMYYREDLLKKYPGGQAIIEQVKKGTTWEQFIRLQAQLKWKGPFYIYTAADFEGLICSYIEILMSLRRDYFETIGFRFDTPEAKQALQLLVDLIHRYHITPSIVSNFTEGPSYEYYIRNDGLFIRGWTSYEKDFTSYPEKEKYLRKAPIPYPANGKPASMFGGWNLMMSKATTKKEAVIDFVKYLLSDEAQEIFYAQSRFYPVIKSFYADSLYLKRYPEIEQMRELMSQGVHRPVQENYTKYSKIMARYFNLAILGNISVDQALQRVHASIESEGTQTVGR
jgi:multiple sugar transport system substrate-binding protein